MKGEVWIYFDRDAGKRRPAVIVGNRLFVKDTDVVIAKITSFPSRNEFELEVENWEEVGMLNPSTVRCNKLYTLKEENLLYKIGKIEGDQLEEIKETIAKYIMQ